MPRTNDAAGADRTKRTDAYAVADLGGGIDHGRRVHSLTNVHGPRENLGESRQNHAWACDLELVGNAGHVWLQRDERGLNGALPDDGSDRGAIDEREIVLIVGVGRMNDAPDLDLGISLHLASQLRGQPAQRLCHAHIIDFRGQKRNPDPCCHSMGAEEYE